MLLEARERCRQPALGQEFASQVLSDAIVIAAGLYVVDERDHIGNEEWINSPSIQRLQKSEATTFLPSPPGSDCSSLVDAILPSPPDSNTSSPVETQLNWIASQPEPSN
ncbi:MAG: hypothetical protein MMC33_010826 [Icmadophila ericetorum]|nr:hypothetical protein [Icmadophila ericetorum]